MSEMNPGYPIWSDGNIPFASLLVDENFADADLIPMNSVLLVASILENASRYFWLRRLAENSAEFICLLK
jgi:hypothetical protein